MVGILTEKPSAGRNFAKALGGVSGTYNGEPYVIVSARGHLFEFAPPEQQVSQSLADRYKSWNLSNLPWNETDFSWKREKKKDVDSTLSGIAAQLSKCDEITIATDVDPTGEGELLAWEILDELNLRPKRWSRMYFTDEAPKSIQQAFTNRKGLQSMETDMDYVKANYRSKFDFLTMQFTRIATANGDGRSVLRQGRLKSAMVLIVGRQLDAIAAYKPTPYYQNRFKDENGVVYTNPDEPQFPSKDQVPKDYHASSVTVDSKTMSHTAPPRLLDLASLSARLSTKGFKAKQVLDVYQKMYESQVVSYPRTEDKVITPEQFNELLPKVDAIAKVVGVDPALLTHREPRKTHVKTGGAHGANRPGPNVPASLDALSSYDLPGCSGLAAAIYVTLAKNYLATLARPTSPTMKWLMTQLEKYDVGTGATRTSIYADVTNEKTKYPLLVERKGKLTMAPYGDMSYKLLPGTHIGDLKMTEQLQADMRDIAAGKADPDECLARVQQMVREDLQTMAANGVTMRAALGIKMASPDDYASGTWNGKNVKFKKSWGGRTFTDDEVQKLLAGEEIKLMGMQGKSGTYNVKGALQEQSFKGRPFVGFAPTGYLNDDGSDRTVAAKNPDEYASGTWKRKKVQFKKIWGGHTFTDDEIQQLLAGKEISFQATSKGGKPYTAKGKLAEQTYEGRKFVGFKADFGKR